MCVKLTLLTNIWGNIKKPCKYLKIQSPCQPKNVIGAHNCDDNLYHLN